MLRFSWCRFDYRDIFIVTACIALLGVFRFGLGLLGLRCLWGGIDVARTYQVSIPDLGAEGVGDCTSDPIPNVF